MSPHNACGERIWFEVKDQYSTCNLSCQCTRDRGHSGRHQSGWFAGVTESGARNLWLTWDQGTT